MNRRTKRKLKLLRMYRAWATERSITQILPTGLVVSSFCLEKSYLNMHRYKAKYYEPSFRRNKRRSCTVIMVGLRDTLILLKNDIDDFRKAFSVPPIFLSNRPLPGKQAELRYINET